MGGDVRATRAGWAALVCIIAFAGAIAGASASASGTSGRTGSALASGAPSRTGSALASRPDARTGSALAGSPSRALARAAKTVYLVESAHLSLAREEGSSLTDSGRATGTYNAPLTATFTIHPASVTALVTVYPHGGSISGKATADYVVQNSTGYFGGTLTITHGTGTYRHAAGKSLGFSGTINRYNFAATVKAHGNVSY